MIAQDIDFFLVSVIPNKAKSSEGQDSNKPESSTLSFASSSYENSGEKYGFGFQKEIKSNDSKQAKDTANLENKKGISFVKGETMTLQAEENAEANAKQEAKKVELGALIDTTMEKLKFLSEGSQPASAVQVMAIQLQVCAFVYKFMKVSLLLQF